MSKDIYLNYLFEINQYFKDKIESFDDYYPCMQKEGNECNLLHVYNWIQFFVSVYNDTIDILRN